MPVVDDTAGELVDHADPPVAHEIVDVATQQHAGMQGTVELGEEREVLGVVQTGDAQIALETRDARLGQLDASTVLVGVEIDTRRQRGDMRRDTTSRCAPSVDLSRDDQRHARLVDQQRVGLVDHRHVEWPVHDVPGIGRPQVAQVIKARLLGGHVGDVSAVRATPRLHHRALLDVGDRHAEHPVDRLHPLGVTSRQVVVERQDVHPLARQGVKRHRHHRRERFALAGSHLDDTSLRERQRRDDLHVEWPETQRAPGHLSHQGEERSAEGLEGSVVRGLGAQRPRLVRELAIGQVGDALLQPADLGHRLVERDEVELDGGATEAGEMMSPSDAVAHATVDVGRCGHAILPLISVREARRPGLWTRRAGRHGDGGYTSANRAGGAREGTSASSDARRSSRRAAARGFHRTANATHSSHSGARTAASWPAAADVTAASTARPMQNQATDLRRRAMR